MNFTKNDILELTHVARLNLINSITGIKPANLIGTISNKGLTNVAIFSSVVHLGSNPPLLGFVLRPNKDVPRHTFQNIKETGVYTINHIHENFIENAHFTSAKFEKTDSEFDKCKLTKQFINNFKAPFVKESEVKIGMKFIESVPFKINDTIFVIGEIQFISVPNKAVTKKGYLDLSLLNNVGISGLNSYYSLEKITDFPYARVSETPNF